ncbi:MAG TPA: penicillin-binding transpeptidase domain-containing protein [Gemmatimonadales bacterium]|jgi:cell division protein FtsI (penicillin-binding protein 3)
MAKPAARILFLEAVLGASVLLILGRSFQVQVIQHATWHARASKRRGGDWIVAARRGRILDRNGHPLAVTGEEYHVSVALDQIRDTAGLRSLLVRHLNVPLARVDAEFRNDYPYFNGPFSAEAIEPLRQVRGVSLPVIYHRIYPMDALAERILGRLDENGTTGIEGMEKALDTLLQGSAGKTHYLVDAKGNRLEAPGPPVITPIAGDDVYLTLDANLQAIAEGALRQAVDTSHARGGDVVIVDVRTGEFLAAASLRTDSVSSKLVSTSSAFVEPNEPGSTSKLFTIAALLRAGRDTTPVEGENGDWVMPIGRTTRRIQDEHKLSGPVTLGETVRFSSNIAISKFSLRLTPAEQFETIRDFGFGTAPATGFPGEAPGKLQRPALWANHLYSQPSLGQGYEWEATAAQLALGYGAIANHGIVMAPTLVWAVRDPRGTVIWRHRPDTLRHAAPESVARQLMAYLEMATDSGGTGSKAQITMYDTPGKTGTAKTSDHSYRASFAGIFPGNNPQVVIYVMIDHPKGHIFGGDVAAPVVRSIVLQALASSESPFDRSRLTAHVAIVAARPAPAETVSVQTVTLPLGHSPVPATREPVPVITGFNLRDAVVALQRAGFEVRLQGRNRVRSTAPAAGDSLPRGATVTLYADSTS